MAKVKCPKCKSTNLQVITDGKKNFSGGKALAAGVLINPVVGIGFGLLGKKGKPEFFCGDCGKRFKK